LNALEKALSRQREITGAAKAENRDLTEDERREFDAQQIIIDALTEKAGKEGGGKRAVAEPETPETPQPEPPKAPEAPNEGARAQGATLTTEQAATIANMCRHFGYDAADYLARGLSVEQTANAILKKKMAESTPVTPGITTVRDEGDKLRRAMVDGMILRGGGQLDKPSEGANNYRGMTIKDIAIECMAREHGATNYRHMGTEEFISAVQRDFYNPESEFPAILEEVVQKSYIEGLNKARVSFDKFVRFGTLPNFKKTTNHEYIMSLGGKLERVPENGELRAYVPQDVAMPERQLDTYGRQFTMSRKAFIDDDIGLLTTMPRRYAEMSMRTQNEAVYDILLNNNKIYDGKILFSKDRKNTLSAGTSVTLEAIEKMILMIGLQKDEAGNQLALAPNLFIVPLGLGVEVQKILGTPTFYSAEGTTINPYYNNNFTVVEDVTLNGMIEEGKPIPWFMGVKGEFIQVDYLNGQREATIRRSEVPGTLGFVWDVYFDFGVSMLHPQAICRNPGVEIKIDD
jgi:hypothetical protein